MQPLERGAHRIDVGQRLAHAHEHDVRHPLLGGVLRAHDLLDDLAGVEVAFEAGLAGGAERAPHRAPGLGRDAHGGAFGAVHQHGLDLRAVGGAPQPLRGVAVGAGLRGDWRQRERQRVGEPGAQRFGQRGELFERSPLSPETVGELGDAILRLAPRNQESFELGARRAVTSGHRAATSRTYARSVRCTEKPSERYSASAGVVGGAEQHRGDRTARVNRLQAGDRERAPSPVPCARGSTPIT